MQKNVQLIIKTKRLNEKIQHHSQTNVLTALQLSHRKCVTYSAGNRTVFWETEFLTKTQHSITF